MTIISNSRAKHQTVKSPKQPAKPTNNHQTRQNMSSYTNAWGDSADPDHAQLHQGPARQATVVTQSSENYPGSMVQLDGASNVPRRSNIRPSMQAARSASDREVRRRRGQTGLMRGPESSTELDQHYPNINFSELQNDLSRVAVPQHSALLTVMHVTANDIAGSHATHRIECRAWRKVTLRVRFGSYGRAPMRQVQGRSMTRRRANRYETLFMVQAA